MLYKKRNNEDDFKWFVPPIDQRIEITKRAHLLGHFGVASNIKALQKERYFWPKMEQDVDFVIDNALDANWIFDRVAIDCLLGLSKTQEGYKGVEYLKKNPFTMPIKSKTAEEIASYIFQFICLFGPQIHTDQDKEFLNKTVERLTTMIGDEQRITSSYHPQTNGLVERFNQNLIKSFKKHADNNTNHWDKFLLWV